MLIRNKACEYTQLHCNFLRNPLTKWPKFRAQLKPQSIISGIFWRNKVACKLCGDDRQAEGGKVKGEGSSSVTVWQQQATLRRRKKKKNPEKTTKQHRTKTPRSVACSTGVNLLQWLNYSGPFCNIWLMLLEIWTRWELPHPLPLDSSNLEYKYLDQYLEYSSENIRCQHYVTILPFDLLMGHHHKFTFACTGKFYRFHF